MQNGKTQRTKCLKRSLRPICPPGLSGLSTGTVNGTPQRPGNRASPADKNQRRTGPTGVSIKPQPGEPEAAQGSVHPPQLHVPRERGERLWFLFSIYLSEPKRTYTSNSTPHTLPSEPSPCPSLPRAACTQIRSQPSAVPSPIVGTEECCPFFLPEAGALSRAGWIRNLVPRPRATSTLKPTSASSSPTNLPARKAASGYLSPPQKSPPSGSACGPKESGP